MIAATLVPAGASDPPPPLFFASEAAFLRQIEEATLDPQLELHLLEYAADPRWSLDWAATRYARSGFLTEHGSTSGSNLFTNAHVAINAFPTASTQFRYDRRLYQDRRFDLRDERFDFLWFPRGAWALVVSGWPSPQKEASTMGLGLRLGAPGGERGLTLLMMNDRPIWNGKTDGSVWFAKAPRRILLDGYGAMGAWRVRGSVDVGLPYEAEDREAPTRSVRGYQRFGDGCGEYQARDWAAGARFTWGSLLREQSQEGLSAYRLDRQYGRVQTYGRTQFRKLAGYGFLGWVWQREVFSSPSIQTGSYHMARLLFGVEVGGWPRGNLELRMGYIGSGGRMERLASPRPGADLPWPDRADATYADKVHARAIWSFTPRLSIEFLLSHTLGGARFGGASFKARFIL